VLIYESVAESQLRIGLATEVAVRR